MAYEFNPPTNPSEFYLKDEPDISMTVFCSYCGLRIYDVGEIPDNCPDCGKEGMTEVDE